MKTSKGDHRRRTGAAEQESTRKMASFRRQANNTRIRHTELDINCSMNTMSKRTALQLFFVSMLIQFVSAETIPDVTVRVTPRVAITAGFAVEGSEMQILTNRAAFGSRSDVSGVLVHSPASDIFLCDVFFNPNATFPEQPPPTVESLIMLVPRGFCTFEQKARAAQDVYGAKGVLIYDRLAARYRWDNETQRVIFPRDQGDYDCAFGSGTVQDLNFDPPPYNGTELNPLLDMRKPTSICNLQTENGARCESQLCLVTSHEENSTEFPVCCAWDVPFALDAADGTDPRDTANIVVALLTIRQSELIVHTELLGSPVTIESRGSFFNASYIFMWMLGTAVTVFAAWYAAKEYRQFGVKIKAMEAKKRNRDTINTPIPSQSPLPSEIFAEIPDRQATDTLEEGGASSAVNRNSSFHDSRQSSIGASSHSSSRNAGSKPSSRSKKPESKRKSDAKSNQEIWTLRSLPPPERRRRGTTSTNNATSTPTTRRQAPAGVMPSYEMNLWHVIIFIVVASLLLVLLFFFQFYGIVFIVYGIGCGGAVSYLIFNPFVCWLIPKFGYGWVEKFNVPRIWRYNGFDILSQSMAYLWSVLWIWYGWTHYQPEKNAFFWITTDVFGATFCVLTVSLLKLNSIKIATILMVAVFVYDIFFVFITPFITGGDSVMLTVASGGGNGAEGFCDKYPEHKDCVGVTFIPMLFILPKVNDPLNGSVILGLGDVVLPGFLVAFCARYDAATRLVGTHSPAFRIKVPSRWYQGFFFPISVAYSLGLLLAFMAVLLMQQGQPALLYICPILLGSIFYLGRGNLKQLWGGAEIFGLAERLMARNERLWERSRSRRMSSGDSGEQREGDDGEHQDSPAPEQSVPTAIPSSENLSPRANDNDVFFRDQSRLGTKEFMRVIRRATCEFEGEDYTPKIHKHVRAQLQGRKFFHRKNASEEWREADKFVVRNEIGLAYDECRGKTSPFFEKSGKQKN